MHALIDNHNLRSKLALRQRFLRKYHAGSRFSVLDCCEGSGRIWRYLRKEFPCDVMGVDLKPAKGRLRLDSRRILELDWLSFDVVDIDTYGSPWGHWLNLLESLTQPATVFLTWGAVELARERATPRCSRPWVSTSRRSKCQGARDEDQRRLSEADDRAGVGARPPDRGGCGGPESGAKRAVPRGQARTGSTGNWRIVSPSRVVPISVR